MLKRRFSAIVLFFCSGFLYAADVRTGDRIDRTVMNQVHAFHATVVAALRSGDVASFYNALADEVKNEDPARYRQLVAGFTGADGVASLTPLAEYSVTNDNPEYRPEPVALPGSGLVATLYLQRDFPDYIMLFTRPGAQTETLFSFVYTNAAGLWKLASFNFNGTYKILERDAIAWFERSQALFRNKQYAVALLVTRLAAECLSPAPFIKYARAGEIVAFGRSLQKIVDHTYAWPVVLKELAFQPAVYGLEVNVVEAGFIPTVAYVTATPLGDAVALEKEARSMAAVIDASFPGLSAVSDRIAFAAYNDPPTAPDKNPACYRTVITSRK